MPVSEPDRKHSPVFWPDHYDYEETGPIGDGTPHARMEWFWERMRGTVGRLAALEVVTDPDRMRHLAGIQAAAWAVVREWVE